MNISTAKLKAILLFFANHTDTRFLGKVKLMKLFYFLDFTHLRNYGAPVTYDTYVNLEHGPIPSTIKNIIDNADDDIEHSVLADTIVIEHPPGIQMSRILPFREFTEKDAKLFSGDELETLKKVCGRFANKTTQEIEDISHQEAPWRETKLLDEIPYTLAAKDSNSLVSEEEIELLLSLSQ